VTEPAAWQQWAPAPAYATPFDQRQPYHRILRTRTYRPWRPFVALLVFAAAFLLLSVVALLPWLVSNLAEIVTAPDLEAAAEATIEVTPVFLLSTNLTLAAAVPAAVLGVLAACRLRPGWLASVTGRFRWGLLLRSTGLAMLVVPAFYLLSLLLPVDEGAAPANTPDPGSLAAYAAVVLLTTPLQAAGEEYAFRGIGLQAIGAFARRPEVGGLVTATLFALAHGSQNLPLFLDRFAFGVVAWWLVTRTGGLEASIAMHAVNNVVVFLVSAAVDQVSESLAVSEAPWSYVLLDIAQLLVFAWLVEVRLVRRGRVELLTPAG
jgi:membrane protease YdiL (CAAX protease family)